MKLHPCTKICFIALGSYCALEEFCLHKESGARGLAQGHAMRTGAEIFEAKPNGKSLDHCKHVLRLQDESPSG